MKTFKTIVRYDDISKELDRKIKKVLTDNGFEYLDEKPEYVIVIGGDGTFLKAVHENIESLDTTYFYGIHTGTLGFFTDYKSDEVDEFLDDFLNKTENIVKYQLLEVEVDNDKKYYAVNEMRIENSLKTQVLDITVNGLELETFRGTGMCVCTQIGSSAYNRSLDGAVIQEGLPLIQMSEIAGIHHSSYRSLGVPIIMSENSIITFKSNDFNGAILCHDAYHTKLDGNKIVTVRLCDKKINMLRFKEISYFKKLQSLF